MWGIWQKEEQCWTSVREKAAWKTREYAEGVMAELERNYPEVKFEVRKCD